MTPDAPSTRPTVVPDDRPRIERVAVGRPGVDRPVVERDADEATTTVIRPLGATAAIGGLWAVAMGLLVVGVPVLIGWALAPGPASSPGDAFRIGVHTWLAAHLVPVTTPQGTVGLLPLGFLLIPGLLLALVGRWAARANAPRDLPDAALLAGALSMAYALAALAVGAWGSNGVIGSPAWLMFLGPLLVALVVTSVSIVRTAGLTPRVRALLPPAVMPALVGATAGVLVLVAGGALVAGIAFAVNLPDAVALTDRLDPGIVGSVLLVILGLGYVPNAALWGASFAVGPGFAVGTGTAITPSAAESAALPAFPLFAALPADGAPPAIAAIALLLPAVAGAVLGLVVARRLRTSAIPDRVLGCAGPERAALLAAFAGAGAGAVFGILAALSGGPLGDGRLATLGPSGWRVGLLAAVALATVGAATAWASARRRSS